MPKAQRCGVLTQPSWLVAHSGNFDNDPVRRGKWIREKLLAGYVMDVPITVQAVIPDSDTMTLRERFEEFDEDGSGGIDASFLGARRRASRIALLAAHNKRPVPLRPVLAGREALRAGAAGARLQGACSGEGGEGAGAGPGAGGGAWQGEGRGMA